MAGRALVFSNPEIVQLLTTGFVPYAGDQWYLHREQDSAGSFFWKVVQQGPRRNAPLDQTRQGVYAATADGELLGALNHPESPEANLQMFRTALRRFQQENPARPGGLVAGQPDATYARTPPPGGLILNVYSRIPLPPPAGMAWWPNMATAQDHLWLTEDEWKSLLPPQWKDGETYPAPPDIADRIARFHLVDNVRGEPDMWSLEDIRSLRMELTVTDAAAGDLELLGGAHMEHGARGYVCRIQGELRYDRSAARFVRLDLLSWGQAWGEGTYTGGAPPGRFPLVIAAGLAGDSPADRVPPQASRMLAAYFHADQ